MVKRRGETRVLGDPEHPVSRGVLCGKCAIAYNGAWRDPTAAGNAIFAASGARARAKFQPIEWDEALGIMAARFNQIIAASSGHRIVQHTIPAPAR